MSRRVPLKSRKKASWKKKASLSKLIRLLDQKTSRELRMSQSDGFGFCTCFTCPTRKRWQEMQCGHYISRSCKGLRYEPDNLRVQCAACNIFKNGNLITFRENLVRELGEERVKDMEAQRFVVHKIPASWYEEQLSMV